MICSFYAHLWIAPFAKSLIEIIVQVFHDSFFRYFCFFLIGFGLLSYRLNGLLLCLSTSEKKCACLCVLRLRGI